MIRGKEVFDSQRIEIWSSQAGDSQGVLKSLHVSAEKTLKTSRQNSIEHTAGENSAFVMGTLLDIVLGLLLISSVCRIRIAASEHTGWQLNIHGATFIRSHSTSVSLQRMDIYAQAPPPPHIVVNSSGLILLTANFYYFPCLAKAAYRCLHLSGGGENKEKANETKNCQTNRWV